MTSASRLLIAVFISPFLFFFFKREVESNRGQSGSATNWSDIGRKKLYLPSCIAEQVRLRWKRDHQEIIRQCPRSQKKPRKKGSLQQVAGVWENYRLVGGRGCAARDETCRIVLLRSRRCGGGAGSRPTDRPTFCVPFLSESLPRRSKLLPRRRFPFSLFISNRTAVCGTAAIS